MSVYLIIQILIKEFLLDVRFKLNEYNTRNLKKMSEITEIKKDVSSSNIIEENSPSQIKTTGKYFMHILLIV